MKITVTQHDIQRGTTLDCHHCPIAHAVARETACAYLVEVDCAETILVDDVPHRPDEKDLLAVADFIGRFDSGEIVHPFSFSLIRKEYS